MNHNTKDNLILKLTFEFAMDIIDFSEILEEKRKFVLGRQILKSGTSIGANSREAQNAESKADFIHKLKIAIKEADECEYWLELCNESKHYPNTDELLSKLISIKKVLNKIIGTTKKLSTNLKISSLTN